MKRIHMNNALKRITAGLICMLIIIGCLSSACAESRDVTFTFPTTGMPEMPFCSWQIDMDDAWFNEPSSVYNHNLAQLSLGMALAAFRDTKAKYGNQDHNLVSFFEEAGFTGYREYGYDQAPTQDTISNGIAYKMLNDAEGEFALVAAPVCGQGYGDEWLSNFTVGDLLVHEGFTVAAINVGERVRQYIKQYLPGKRVKIWLTGFSRAAAVSNMAANLLLNDPSFEADNIFGYHFACPNNTMVKSEYPQLHNICGSFDPVPSVPLPDWGYSKYGVTSYLPALETTSDYRELEARAREKYVQIFGTDKGFAASHDRNWLLSRILNMLLEFMPNAEDYANTYQRGLKAAWAQKGSIGSKIQALRDNVSVKGKQLEVLEKMRGELLNLVSIGVSDTINAMYDGKSTLWVDVLSTGSNIAHEHFPAVYLAWMLSTENPEELFAQGPYYHRLIVTGSPMISITSIDPETGRRLIVYNPNMYINKLATIKLSNQIFIDLPCDRAYEIGISARSDDVVQIGFGTADVRLVSLPLRTTYSVGMKIGEYITMNVPAGQKIDDQVEILLNGDEPLALSESDDKGGIKEFHMAGVDVSAKLDVISYIINLTCVILTLTAVLILLIYALVVLIKRIVRGPRPDHISCTIWGRVMLYIIAAASLLLFVYELYSAIMMLSISEVPINNRILQTVSNVYLLSVKIYSIFECMVYGLTVLLCVRSISHSFSRIRLIRLSILLFLMGLLNSFISLENSAFSLFSAVELLLPLLAIIAVLVARGLHPQGDDISNAWMPAIRTFVFTGIIFLIYEIVLMFTGSYSRLTGIVKGLTGLPILISSALTWKHQKDLLHCATFISVLLYMAANVVINFNMLFGLILHLLGHCVLTYSFIRTKKPKAAQFFIWIGVSVLLCLQLFTMRRYLSTPVLYGGFVYVVALAAMVISSFSFTKQLWIGTVLFLVSNELLLLTFRKPDVFALGALELLVFYAAVLIIGTDSDAIRAQVRKKTDAVSISEKTDAE